MMQALNLFGCDGVIQVNSTPLERGQRMMSKRDAGSEVLDFLNSLPLFSSLSPSSLSSLGRECRFKQVEKGGILFFQSDPSDSAFIVRSGKISIILNSPDGREMTINEMHAGDMFGELGIITKKARSTSAIARSKSEVLVIPQRAFTTIVEREPNFAIRILEITAERLQASGKRESALVFMDAQARLAHLLLELNKQEADIGYITISQDELAQRTGLIRQTVAKALGNWRRKGYLLTGRGRIVLLNHKALRELENQLIV
jgi:CRP-like cAMP-binding protein